MLRYARLVNERELVAALKAGDEDAFRTLIETYHPMLVRVARAYVPTSTAAEEVAADTWLAVLEGIDRFEERSSLKTWIFRILTNKAKTRGMRERRSLPFSSLEADDSSVDSDRFHGAEHRWPGHWAAAPQGFPGGAAARGRDPRGGRARDRGAAAGAAGGHLAPGRRRLERRGGL